MTIWLYWEGKKPPHIALCHAAFRKFTKKHGYLLNVVTPENITKYLPDLPSKIWDIQCNNATQNPIAIRCGYIRAFLLEKYGGLYSDSDTIPLQSWNSIWGMLETQEFVCLRRSSFNHNHISIGFLACKPGTTVIRLWRDALLQRLSGSSVHGWGEVGAHMLTPIVNVHAEMVSILPESLIMPVTCEEQERFALPGTVPPDAIALTLFHRIFERPINGQCLKGIAPIDLYNADNLLGSCLRQALTPEEAASEARVWHKQNALGNRTMQQLLAQANAAFKEKNYATALELADEGMRRFPGRPGFVKLASLSLMSMGRFAECEKTCRDGMERFPNHVQFYATYALCASKSGKEDEARVRYSLMREKYPQDIRGYVNAALLEMDAGNVNQALQLYSSGISQSGWNPIYVDILAGCAQKCNDVDVLLQAFLACIPLLMKGNVQVLLPLLRIIEQNKENTPLRSIAIASFSQCVHQCHISQQSGQSPSLRKKGRLAFWGGIAQLSFIAPILKKIGPKNLNIILKNQDNEIQKDIIDSNDLDQFNIMYGHDECKNYYFLITDQVNFSRDKNLSFLENYWIIYTHGNDAMFGGRCNLAHAVIAQSTSQLVQQYFFMKNIINKEAFNVLSIDNKCEGIALGPYNLFKYFTYDNKQAAIQELEKFFCIEINRKKPIIAVLEDELTNNYNLVDLLNVLAKSCTIILKPYHLSFPTNALDKEIILYKKWKKRTLSPTLLKRCADFVLAGLFSGTFISSVMAGIPVIPYYSRLITYKSKKFEYLNAKNIYYANKLPIKIDRNSSISHKLFFYWQNKYLLDFFDVEDVNKVYSAIFDKDYITKYKKCLHNLQNDVFGEYNLDNIDEKAAQHILNFVENGTFGYENITGLYIKSF